jgi:hypothetical protein
VNKATNQTKGETTMKTTTTGYTVKREGSSYTQWFPYYRDAQFFRDTENRRHNSGWYIVKEAR